MKWLARGFLIVSIVVSISAAHAADCAQPTADCPDVAKLLAQREGYGRAATGGLGGAFVLVTSDADAGPGTLREAVSGAKSPRWIKFSRDMAITLSKQLRVPSNVTIDGRGRSVTLQDHGLSILGARNVIVTHLKVDGRLRTFGQGIDIANGSRDVWANHLDLSRFNDRLMNVKNGATDVTISWVKFHDHNKVMLINNVTDRNIFANYNRDSKARVSLHGNWFVNTVQRNPRAVMATIHMYNNLLEDWDFYGMNFSLEAKVLLEGNMFANKTQRACKEPESYQTTHEVERNYCHGIATAAKRAVNPNGKSEEKAYQDGVARYGYAAREWRAFIKANDNVGFGDVDLDIEQYRQTDVPSPGYCYSYAKPSAELANVIRAHAGVTRDAPALPKVCAR